VSLGRLLRSALLIVVVAGLVGGAAYGLSVGQPVEYRATTQLLFGPSGGSILDVVTGTTSSDPDESRAIANAVADVGSFDVARRTAGVLTSPRLNAGEISNRVEVSNPTGTDVVVISARGPTPEDAARLAGAYRTQYNLQRKARLVDRARRARRTLQAQLRGLSPRQRRGPRGLSLSTQIGQLRVFEKVGSGVPSVVQGVRASGAPVDNTQRNTLFGLLLGAVLGGGLLALRSLVRGDHGAARTPGAERLPSSDD
jgi:uncharacterized protein involved in exopolysaccharide biosynthesis